LLLDANTALSIVPGLHRIWDEPFADSSQLPTQLVMQLARKSVTVALSGDGGDEIFCGYNRYTHAPKLAQRLGWMPPLLRHCLATLLTAVPATTVNHLLDAFTSRHGISLPGDKAHKLGNKLRDGDFDSIDRIYAGLVTEWPSAETLVVDGTIPANLLDERQRWPQLADPVARMMALDGLIYLPDDILVKVDRAAMAVSLETRAPFLDKHVIEFAWSLPMHFKQRDGEGKWLLRRLLDRYVPNQLIDRPKMGFGVPLDDWLRGPLRDWAETLLDENRLVREGFFHPSPVRQAWERHLSGRDNHGHRLWSILMFQSWFEARA
jgi:asparagine synthase (glutamine-hydrolysing)